MIQRIKFSNKDKSKFYSTVKSNVNEYFREHNLSPHANTEMVMKTIILLGTYLGCYALMLLVHLSTPVLFITFVVQGIAIAGI
ncbi:MAG TPA: acyl-CoA desaturase, partial [Bacteroidia bacterium]|nr:acyl-CoA desaturase [Bacteroidia bacterium]